MAPGDSPMRARPRVVRLVDMRNAVRDKLIDEVMEAYVDWRQESADVESAYQRWSLAVSSDPTGTFVAYLAALEREEFAALVYAEVMQRTARLLARERRRRALASRRRLQARRPSRGRPRSGSRSRSGPGPRGATHPARRGRRTRD